MNLTASRFIESGTGDNAGRHSAGPAFGEDNHDYWTIGEMARYYDVSLRALRFYEDKKLLKPLRHSTMRLYDGRQRTLLRMILKGKKMGFTLAEIREMIAGYREEELVELDQALEPRQIETQIDLLQRQREGIEKAIQELKLTHARLAGSTAPEGISDGLAEQRNGPLPQSA